MQNRSAFTAKYWGDKAVVCHASEDRPGPVVDQEFGEFETWTQAKMFAAKLNEGLETPSAEAEQIISSSILRTSELLSEADLPGVAGGPRRTSEVHGSPRLQLMLVELELAVTFCRIVQSKPSEHTERLLRNARNTLFNAMHFVCHSELAGSELDAITRRFGELHAALEESFALG